MRNGYESALSQVKDVLTSFGNEQKSILSEKRSIRQDRLKAFAVKMAQLKEAEKQIKACMTSPEIKALVKRANKILNCYAGPFRIMSEVELNFPWKQQVPVDGVNYCMFSELYGLRATVDTRGLIRYGFMIDDGFREWGGPRFEIKRIDPESREEKLITAFWHYVEMKDLVSYFEGILDDPSPYDCLAVYQPFFELGRYANARSAKKLVVSCIANFVQTEGVKKQNENVAGLKRKLEEMLQPMSPRPMEFGYL